MIPLLIWIIYPDDLDPTVGHGILDEMPRHDDRYFNSIAIFVFQILSVHPVR